METEIWKDIPNYEGIYQVSNLGRVKSLERLRLNCYGSISKVRERILAKKIDKYGYVCYSLCKNSIQLYFTAHKLVSLCFIDNPNPLIFNQINHKDGNKLNNTPENIEWSNSILNNRHAVKIGLKGGKPYKPRIDATPINQLNKNGEIIRKYQSLAEAARISGVLKTAIGNCLRGRSKSSGGYLWEFNK